MSKPRVTAEKPAALVQAGEHHGAVERVAGDLRVGAAVALPESREHRVAVALLARS